MSLSNPIGTLADATTNSAFGNIFATVTDVAGQYMKYDLAKRGVDTTPMAYGPQPQVQAPVTYTTGQTTNPAFDPRVGRNSGFGFGGLTQNTMVLIVAAVVALFVLKS